MPTNVDKAAKAARKAAREEACAKAKQWSETLKGKGGGGTNVKSTKAAKSPLKPKQKKSSKSTSKKSTPKKQSAATNKSTTANPTETTRKTPSRASRKAAAIANAQKWHDSRQAKGTGCKVPSTIKVETVYPEDEVDDELSNEDDFKTANQNGTPAKATPTKVAKGQKELVMLKQDVKNIYDRLSLLCDTNVDNVDDAMDCS